MSKEYRFQRFDNIGGDADERLYQPIPCSTGRWVQAQDALDQQAIWKAEAETLREQLRLALEKLQMHRHSSKSYHELEQAKQVVHIEFLQSWIERLINEKQRAFAGVASDDVQISINHDAGYSNGN